MAVVERKPVQFSLPLTPSSYNHNTLWPAQSGQSLRPNNRHIQKVPKYNQQNQLYKGYGQFKSSATNNFARSGRQDEVDWKTATRAEGCKRTLANDDEESDDDLLSLEEVFRIAQPLKVSTEASKTERTLQYLKRPALEQAGIQVNRTKSGLGERQGDGPDRPMILDDESNKAGAGDKAEDASGDVDTGRIGQDASPYDTLAPSELASRPTKSIDTSGPWYDVEEGCWIDEPAPRLGSCEQQGVSSTPAQDQPQILPQSSAPLQDQISQQDIGALSQSMLVESAPCSLPKPSDNGDDGWTDDSMAELEEEVGMALVEQVKSPSASAPSSPRPSRSVEASQDEIKSRQCTETTGRSEELRDASRRGTPDQDLAEGEQRETRVVVEIVGDRKQQEEGLVGEVAGGETRHDEEQEFEEPAMGEQQDGEEEDDFNNPADADYHDTSDDEEDLRPKKRRKCLDHPCLMPPLATQLEIDDAQSQADDGCPPTPIGNKHHHPSRTPRRPSAIAESVLAAEYEEWPLRGFLKRTRIGRTTSFNLEFHLTDVPEHLELSGLSEALCSNIRASAQHRTSHGAVVHSKTRHVKPRHPMKRIPWTKEEDETLVKMKEEDGCSWEEISDALPSRTPGAIQVHYSTKLGSGAGLRKRPR